MNYDRDEEGQPIYDPDEDAAEEEWQQPPVEEDVWQHEQEGQNLEARSPSPGHESDAEDASRATNKPRKRLVKKAAVEESQRRKYKEKTRSSAAETSSRLFKSDGRDGEMNEMWNSVAGTGGDSEDDKEGERTHDDNAFIDDAGVDAAEQFVASDEEAGSAGAAPQAEEGEDEEDDLKRIFKGGKKRKAVERSEEEIEIMVNGFMEKLERAAEDDAELNRRSKPAINKLKLLPVLVNVLQKRQFQNEFLDRGVLTLLKNWLEPLPDGSLPNMNIRTAILNLLNDLPIDLEQEDRKEQLKRSGLGKVVMFLSKLDEETPGNKKMAKELVDKWSRPLFRKSTRYDSRRDEEEERSVVQQRRPPPKKSARRDSADEEEESQQGKSAYRTVRPEAVAMDFVVRPQSKVDMDAIYNKKPAKEQTKRQKMSKKLQQRAPRKKLQAERISAEGRGLTKFI